MSINVRRWKKRLSSYDCERCGNAAMAMPAEKHRICHGQRSGRAMKQRTRETPRDYSLPMRVSVPGKMLFTAVGFGFSLLRFEQGEHKAAWGRFRPRRRRNF
jgi:hypothetical protein